MKVSPPFNSDATFKYTLSANGIDFLIATDDLLETGLRTITVTVGLVDFPYPDLLPIDSKSFTVDTINPCRNAKAVITKAIL